MMSRGGPPVKILAFALFLAVGIYSIYTFNVTHNRLKDAESTAERYRREEEAKVIQLQELLKSKDDLQDKCDNDRQEFVNRLNSCNQQSKMLKGRNEELEIESSRYQHEAEKVREDQQRLDSQRLQEFQQFKQEKELEIATAKNQVADLTRQNEQLQNEISNLRTQLQNSQTLFQQSQSTLQTLEIKVMQLQQENQKLTLQQQVPHQNAPAENGVISMHMGNMGDNLNAGVAQLNSQHQMNGPVAGGDNQQLAANNLAGGIQQLPTIAAVIGAGAGAGVHDQGGIVAQQAELQYANAQHQVQPPDVNGIQKNQGGLAQFPGEQNQHPGDQLHHLDDQFRDQEAQNPGGRVQVAAPHLGAQEAQHLVEHWILAVLQISKFGCRNFNFTGNWEQ